MVNVVRLFACIAFVACSVQDINGQSWNWANRFGGPGIDNATGQCLDAVGNVYTVSYVNGSVNFGSGPIATNGGTDIVVTKHNPGGLLVWYRLIGGAGTESAADIVRDPSGNLYIAGKFSGTMTCGPNVLTAVYDDIFVAKLDGNGNVLWGISGGSVGSGLEYTAGLSFSAIDNSVVICGIIDSTGYFGQDTVANSQTFFAKVDAGGNWLWALPTNPIPDALIGDVFTDVSGNIYLSTAENGYQHLKKFTSSGTLMWTRTSSNAYVYGFKFCYDGSNHFYLTGMYNAPFSMGAVSLPAPGSSWTRYIIKFDTSGTAEWGKDFQGGSVTANGIAVSPSGDVYVGGRFSNTLYIDTTFMADSYNEGLEAFVIKLNSSGTFQWMKQMGTDGSDAVNDLNYFSGKIYFCGQIEDIPNASFWPMFMASPYGNADGIIGQFNDCTPPYTQVTPDTNIMVCEGDSIHLQSTNTSGSISYVWQLNGMDLNNATTPYLDMVGNALYSGAYAVEITSNGCSYISHYVNVFIFPLPTTTISSTNYGPSCDRDSIKLTAGYLPLHDYQWLSNNSPIPGDTTNIYMVHNSGNYSVIVTSPFGCIDTMSNPYVYIGAYPVISAAGDTAICYGSSAPLSVNGASIYIWLPTSSVNNSSSPTPIATPTTTTTYTVVGTTGTCNDSAYVIVQVYPQLSPVISYNGYQLSCTATYPTYQWYLNGVPVVGATSQVISPTGNGSYQLVVGDTNGCTGSSNILPVNNVGIHETSVLAGELIIYPQPMTDQSTVVLPLTIDEGTATLYTFAGQVMRTVEIFNTNQVVLNREGIDAGVYIVEISCSSGRFLGKIVVN